MFLTDKIRITYHQGRYKVTRELLNGSGPRLLDLGCGQPCEVMPDGSFLSFIGYGVGLDLKPCKLSWPFAQGELEALPFKDAVFDAVTALEVLEHLSHPKKALAEIRRVLKPEGVLVMSSPHHSLIFKALWWLWVRTVGRMWREAHKTDWTRRRWLDFFNQLSGFRLIQTRSHWGFLFLAKWEKFSS